MNQHSTKAGDSSSPLRGIMIALAIQEGEKSGNRKKWFQKERFSLTFSADISLSRIVSKNYPSLQGRVIFFKGHMAIQGKIRVPIMRKKEEWILGRQVAVLVHTEQTLNQETNQLSANCSAMMETKGWKRILLRLLVYIRWQKASLWRWDLRKEKKDEKI